MSVSRCIAKALNNLIDQISKYIGNPVATENINIYDAGPSNDKLQEIIVIVPRYGDILSGFMHSFPDAAKLNVTVNVYKNDILIDSIPCIISGTTRIILAKEINLLSRMCVVELIIKFDKPQEMKNKKVDGIYVSLDTEQRKALFTRPAIL